MGLRNHALLTVSFAAGAGLQTPPPETYQEFISTQRHLPLGTRDSHFIACLLGARKGNLAIPLFLQLLDFGQAGDELSVIQPIDMDNL